MIFASRQRDPLNPTLLWLSWLPESIKNFGISVKHTVIGSRYTASH